MGTFGDNARVMLVGNKADQVAVNLDLFSLRQKYSNVIDFYPLSCTGRNEPFELNLNGSRSTSIRHYSISASAAGASPRVSLKCSRLSRVKLVKATFCTISLNQPAMFFQLFTRWSAVRQATA